MADEEEEFPFADGGSFWRCSERLLSRVVASAVLENLEDRLLDEVLGELDKSDNLSLLDRGCTGWVGEGEVAIFWRSDFRALVLECYMLVLLFLSKR